jgi:DNA mismatch endonuclease (patch repair protein)
MYQPRNIYGRPDFASRKYKLAIFIDGCFWHGCKEHFAMPRSNMDFWQEKITRNRNHDKKVTNILKREGWNVVRIWEHDVINSPEKCKMLVNLQAIRNK